MHAFTLLAIRFRISVRLNAALLLFALVFELHFGVFFAKMRDVEGGTATNSIHEEEDDVKKRHEGTVPLSLAVECSVLLTLLFASTWIAVEVRNSGSSSR